MILLGDWAPGECECRVRLNGAAAAREAGEQVVLLNLEGPVLCDADRPPPAPKAGPHLYTTRVPALPRRLVCSLANNHLMDFGAAGLRATCDALRTAGIQFIGAGDDLLAARQPGMIDDRGARVAIIACCESQFGAAAGADDAPRAGVAVYGPWIYAAIREARARADAVVISVHAGAEMSPWPAPALQDLYRSWIDAGADVVHGHHAHVPQGFEAYGRGVIFYGLGNLAVEPEKWRNYPAALSSLGADVRFTRDGVADWRVFSLDVQEADGGIEVQAQDADARAAQRLVRGRESLCDDERGARALARARGSDGSVHGRASGQQRYIEQCNAALRHRERLTGLWQETAVRTYRQHYRAWLGFARDERDAAAALSAAPSGASSAAARAQRSWRTLLPRRAGAAAPPRYAPSSSLLLWHVLLACDTHRDLIATALGVIGGELPDLRDDETRALMDEFAPWTVAFADAPRPAPAEVAAHA